MSEAQDFAPWTLKQVSPEARTAAKLAAAKANMQIGKWVERMVLEAAQRELTAPQELAVVPAARDGLPAVYIPPQAPPEDVARLTAIAAALGATVAIHPDKGTKAAGIKRKLLDRLAAQL